MNEWFIIYVLTVSSALFAIGGTKCKALRRYLLPLAIGLPSIYYAPWQGIVAYILSLSFALHLGYGDRCSQFMRMVIFSLYTLPCLFIGFSWWTFIFPILFFFAMLLSKSKQTESMFFWKGTEVFFGMGIGISFINSLQNCWR